MRPFERQTADYVTIGQLTQPAQPVDASMTCPEADRIFSLNPGLASLIVRMQDGELCVLDRNDFMQALHEEGIGTGLHFPALHLASFYAKKYGYAPGSLPVAEAAGASILSLPLYPLLTEADQDDVVAAARRVLARHRRAVAPSVASRARQAEAGA